MSVIFFFLKGKINQILPLEKKLKYDQKNLKSG